MKHQIRRPFSSIAAQTELEAAITALQFRTGELTREQVIERIEAKPDATKELFREKLNVYRNQVRVYEQKI